jgi:peptidoglycan/LPS O-acetylase OafA/YrhL
MILGLLACVLETKWLYGFHENGIGATKISALVFSCSTVMFLFNEKTQSFLESNKFWYKSLVYVGELSFGIYLIHKYILDYIIAPNINDTFLRAIITLISSVVIITLIKKILPSTISRLLGFR